MWTTCFGISASQTEEYGRQESWQDQGSWLEAPCAVWFVRFGAGEKGCVNDQKVDDASTLPFVCRNEAQLRHK